MVHKFLSAIKINYLLNSGDYHQRKRRQPNQRSSFSEMVQHAKKNEQPSVCEADRDDDQRTTHEVILEAELDSANREIEELKQKFHYKTKTYTLSELEGNVIGMIEVFNIVVKQAFRLH